MAPITRLKRRADFREASKGRRAHGPAFTLQAARRRPAPAGEAEPEGARFGFTVTRKVGTATERNRIRRRLREALRLHAALEADAGTDYVLVARRDALARPFGRLMADLDHAVRKVAEGRARPERGRAERPGDPRSEEAGRRSASAPIAVDRPPVP